MSMDETTLTKELPDEAPFWSKVITLALVIDGKVYASHTTGAKADMLKEAAKAQYIIATWTGQYRSDIFTVPMKRIKAEAKTLKQ